MNFTFLVVVLLTALAFVGVVIALSRAISPRSYNLQKFEAYECGIPTRGKSWMQFRVGLSTGGAAIHCGLLPLQPVVVVSNLWHWVPRVMTWPALGLK